MEVTNPENDQTVRVRINDRGPFVRGRVIDLSRAAASAIGLIGPGVGPVKLTVVSLGVEAEPVSDAGLWAVQVGSFADRERAERYAEKVRGAGHSAFLEPYRGLSRVKVGPYDSRHQAQEALEQLQDAGFEGIIAPAEGISARGRS